MNAVDLFAGCGGLSLGLQQAGIEIVAAIERDPDACASYRANVGDHMIEANIEDVDAASLPDCDLIAGGPPCQGFSNAGKRDKDDPRNQLWREYWRIVEAKRPAWILIENVRGMLSMGEDKPLILAFRALGYHVSPYLLNAADYGVPQVRLRVFYVGNRIGVANPCPAPTHAQPPRHLMFGLEPWVTVRQALGIGWTMTHKFSPTDASCGSPWYNGDERPAFALAAQPHQGIDAHHLLDEPSRALRHGVHGQPGYSPRHEAGYVLDDVADAESRLDRPALTVTHGGRRGKRGDPKYPGNFVPTDAPPLLMRDKMNDDGTRTVWHDVSDRPSRAVGVDSRFEVMEHSDDFPLDRPALTIQCDSRVSRPGHHGPAEPRMGLRRLTVRECSLLQDFPPSFVFHGSKTSQYRQVGNAVALGMARALGEAILAADAKAREGAA